MSARKIKRRIMQLFYGRFYGPFLWRSQEEQAWLDMPPVGREFGSPDYDRYSTDEAFQTGSRVNANNKATAMSGLERST